MQPDEVPDAEFELFLRFDRQSKYKKTDEFVGFLFVSLISECAGRLPKLPLIPQLRFARQTDNSLTIR